MKSPVYTTRVQSQVKVANVFMYEIMNIEQHMHIPDAMKAPDSSVSRGVFHNTFSKTQFLQGVGRDTST